MFLEKLDIIVTVLAVAVVAVISFLGGRPLFETAVRLIMTIAVFYVFGLFIKLYLKNSVFKDNDIDDKPDSDKTETENTNIDI